MSNTTDADFVSPHVSPTLHEQSLKPWEGIAGDKSHGSVAYASGQGALRAVYKSLHDLETAHASIRRPLAPGERPSAGNAAQGEPAIVSYAIDPVDVERFNTAAGARFQSTVTAFASYEKQLKESIAKLDRRIDTALSNPRRDTVSVATAASDIRAIVLGMDASERMAFLHKCLDEGDHETISAVLQATHVASGLTKAEKDTLRTMAARQFCRPLHDTREAAGRIAEHVNNAGKLFAERYSQLTRRPPPSKSDAALKAVRENAS